MATWFDAGLVEGLTLRAKACLAIKVHGLALGVQMDMPETLALRESQ